MMFGMCSVPPGLVLGRPLAVPISVRLLTCWGACGFPSPADDYEEEAIDLGARLMPRPASTFLLRAAGDSMTGAGIFDGDTLIVDRAIEPTPGRVVVVALDGRLAVKRLRLEDGRPVLASENDAHPPVDLQALGDGQRAEVWGVVTYVLHKP